MFTKVTQQNCSKIKKAEGFFFPWNTTFNQKVQSWKDAVTIDGPQILGFSYLIEFLMQLSKVCLLKSFPIYLGQKATYYYVVRILKRGFFIRNGFKKVGSKNTNIIIQEGVRTLFYP